MQTFALFTVPVNTDDRLQVSSSLALFEPLVQCGAQANKPSR